MLIILMADGRVLLQEEGRTHPEEGRGALPEKEGRIHLQRQDDLLAVGRFLCLT